MSLNLAMLLTESAKNHPEDVAVIYESFKMTYAQLDAASNQFANGLDKMGIKRGENVGLMLPNIPQFLIAYYGILKLGAVVVPMNVQFKASEVDYILNDSDAVALITMDAFMTEAFKGYQHAALCRHLIMVQTMGLDIPLPDHGVVKFEEVYKESSPVFDLTPTSPDDTAVIIYTSGTTGRPKGAQLTHFNMFYTAVSSRKLVPPSPNDVAIAILPLFHIFGQSSVMNCMLERAGTITLVPRFEAGKVLEVIERDKVTLFEGVPTMYFAVLYHPEHKNYNTSSLKYGISGGAAIPVEVLHAFEKEFNVPVLEGYGLSETCATATFNDVEHPRKAGSIGRANAGISVKVVDAHDREVSRGEKGEVIIRGYNVMKGYYKRPEETTESLRSDWLHTGDIGYMDEDGYIYIVDRVKDMIIRGGYNVYPREIEEVMYQHPAVREVAIVGIPDPRMGEDIKAYVSLKVGTTATPEELIEFTRERVANYKYPREVEIMEELPKNSTGKILKTELRKLVTQSVS
ncbi:MAG TPA: long-chain fatty acid--CoA ligase [Chloroflexia bacterium]|nr:long-chain fatty acid--CoA ligase [Chloroflexia bacterium]